MHFLPPLDSILMQFPKERSDLFIFAPSFYLTFLLSAVAEALSLPAKSTI